MQKVAMVLLLTLLFSLVSLGWGNQVAKAAPNWEHEQLFECHMDMYMGWKGPEHDYHWLNMMINQDTCLIEVSQHAIDRSDRPEVKQFSRAIIDRSRKEVEQLKAWRKEWYGK